MQILATVIEHFEVGPSIRLIKLNAPEVAQKAQPGQFVMLKVSHGTDPILARPLSVHMAEGDELSLLYRIVGRGTKLLRLARPGHKKLSVWGPLGSGFDLDCERPVLVAGGMGIAPMVYTARAFRQKGLDPVCLYGVESHKAHTAPGRELSGGRYLIDDHPWQTTTIDGSFGQKGLVTEILKDLVELPKSLGPDMVLACGPLPMLKAAAEICGLASVSCQTSLEAPMACGLGACLGCALPKAGGGYLRACREGPVLAAEKLDWSLL